MDGLNPIYKKYLFHGWIGWIFFKKLDWMNFIVDKYEFDGSNCHSYHKPSYIRVFFLVLHKKIQC